MVEKQEWFGEYSMNHDGWQGTLTITDTKIDCFSPPWCDMAIRYQNSEGDRFTGKIEKIDDHGQHMLFTINFPDNEQKFDAYIFSWDKSKLAGITYWGGRKFGFYAVKE